MKRGSRLVGVDVADERELAGRVLGWMLVLSTIVAIVLPVLPGVDGDVITPTLPIGIAALVFGVIALRRIRWANVPGAGIHAAVLAGAIGVAIATSDNGGGNSPARFLLMLVLVFTGYFFSGREAWPYLGVVVILHALPLAYDRSAIDTGLLGELLVVTPCYAILMFMLINGKRGMVELRERADDLARRDPLTGLANRRALLEAAQIGPGRRAVDQVGLLLLDVDDFKLANTLHGHPGGDRALRFVALALRSVARETDLPARLGGDEFAVLVRGATPDAMEALAERTLEAVRASDGTLDLPGFVLRISAGWALDEPDADTLLAAADTALGRAKRAGKDQALSQYLTDAR
jgi:diguanylate cyclase (GGDEF)-like protein